MMYGLSGRTVSVFMTPDVPPPRSTIFVLNLIMLITVEIELPAFIDLMACGQSIRAKGERHRLSGAL